jgi:Uma2 family endonuclease
MRDSAAPILESPRKKLWTREEADRLTELFPMERYELIEGELIDKIGQKPPHAFHIMQISDALKDVFGRGRVRVQLPIALPEPDGQHSEPEPDIVLLKRASREYKNRHPGPADIDLLIEVADVTFRLDRRTKYRLYARAAIREYWVVDVPGYRTVVCRDPDGDEYKSVNIYSADEEVRPVAAHEFIYSLERLMQQDY